MKYDHQPGAIGLAAATIDEMSVKGELPKVDHHIFLDEKAGWYDLPDDNLERFAQHRPKFQKALDASRRS